jgi:hypothetical protein
LPCFFESFQTLIFDEYIYHLREEAQNVKSEFRLAKTKKKTKPRTIAANVGECKMMKIAGNKNHGLVSVCFDHSIQQRHGVASMTLVHRVILMFDVGNNSGGKLASHAS